MPAGLAPDTSHRFSEQLRIFTPAEGGPPTRGVYVLGMIVDPIDEVPEKFEKNNLLRLDQRRIFVDRPAAARNCQLYR